MYYAYSTDYLINLDHPVSIDVEPSTTIRQAEVTVFNGMRQTCLQLLQRAYLAPRPTLGTRSSHTRQRIYREIARLIISADAISANGV